MSLDLLVWIGFSILTAFCIVITLKSCLRFAAQINRNEYREIDQYPNYEVIRPGNVVLPETTTRFEDIIPPPKDPTFEEYKTAIENLEAKAKDYKLRGLSLLAAEEEKEAAKLRAAAKALYNGQL